MTSTHRWILWGCLLIGAGACGSGDDPDGTEAAARAFCSRVATEVDAFLDTYPAPGGPEYGGTAVVGGLGELRDGMNALAFSDYASQQHQAYVHLLTLVRYDEAFEPVPWLAHSWEITDSTLTFRLRDDVRWHDGRHTTARDVAFTFRRAVDPRTAFPNAAYWAPYDPEGVEVVDSLTVRFRVARHHEMLDPWRVTSIMPRHLLKDVPPGELRRHPFSQECPVGNGPFRFVEHRPDERWVFARNPAFPEALGGPPRLERLVYRVFADQSTILADLLTGGVDVYLGTSPEHAEQIRASEEAGLLAFPFRRINFVGWNARLPMFRDSRVRRALTQALDRRAMVEGILRGYGEILNASVPPVHWAYDPELESALPHDPERAGALLAEAGWVDRDGDGVREDPGGRPFSFTIKYNRGSDLRREVAEIAQAQLARVGVEAMPEVVDYGTLISQLGPPVRDYEAFVMGFMPDFKLDDTELFHSERVDGFLAWSGIQDQELDRYLDTLQLVAERERALPLWRGYQDLLVELQPFTFLFSPLRTTGVHRRLWDVVMDARGEWVNVHEWRIPPEARR